MMRALNLSWPRYSSDGREKAMELRRRRATELGAPLALIVGLAEPDVASLIQKAYRDRKFMDAACRLQKFFRGRRADGAARRLQKFFRRKIAIPRTTERRTHRRTHDARVIPDDDSKIAASDAWRLTLEEQLRDPPLRVVHESITASSAAKLAWSEARRRLSFSHDDYTLHRGRIFYKALDGLRLV
eukprot:1235965-Pleurochrysis_carterae.AAC.1